MSKRKSHQPLKVIEKLEYGRDYAEVFWLLLAAYLVVLTMFLGPVIAMIAAPVFFFYLAAVQIHSEIGLTVLGRYGGKLIAKYRKHDDLFFYYLNVGFCLVGGVASSVLLLFIFFAVKP